MAQVHDSSPDPRVVDEEEDLKPPGRPSRSFRSQVVAYIENFVRTGEQLASLAALLGRNEETLRRWHQEDATSSLVIPPAGEDANVYGALLTLEETTPGGVLGDILQNVLRRQKAFLVETLRDMSTTMTLGELQGVLNSRLGRLVADLTVRAVFPADFRVPFDVLEILKTFDATRAERRAARTPATGFTVNAPAPEFCTNLPDSTTGPTPPAAPSQPPDSTRGPAPPATPPLEGDDEAIVKFLREHPGWQRSAAVRQHVACTEKSFREAMARLREKSIVTRRGGGPVTEYSLEPGKTEVVVRQDDVTMPAEAPSAAPTTLEAMIKAILKALYEAKRPLTPAEIRQSTGCTPTQFHKAIQFLKNNGEVTMVGKHPRPAYRVAEVAQVRKSPEPIDANEQVVLALRDTPGMGGTMTLGEIKGATKLSDEQVRRALHDLLAAGRITREGRSANRRYGLAVVIE